MQELNWLWSWLEGVTGWDLDLLKFLTGAVSASTAMTLWRVGSYLTVKFVLPRWRAYNSRRASRLALAEEAHLRDMVSRLHAILRIAPIAVLGAESAAAASPEVGSPPTANTAAKLPVNAEGPVNCAVSFPAWSAPGIVWQVGAVGADAAKASRFRCTCGKEGTPAELQGHCMSTGSGKRVCTGTWVTVPEDGDVYRCEACGTCGTRKALENHRYPGPRGKYPGSMVKCGCSTWTKVSADT
jgi:hypothetical protein